MITEIQGRKHQIVKRDGTLEPYNPDKLTKVLMWACDNKEEYVTDIIQDINIKLYDKMHISKLYDEVIQTAANKINAMYPFYDIIAKRLYLQKIYKETWNIKRTDGEYPDYSLVLRKGVKLGLYDKTVIDSFTDAEIAELSSYIDQSLDREFDYLGLNIFMDKYSFGTQSSKLELPQHGFMRLAMFAFWREPSNRLALIRQRYTDLSLFRFSEATPKWLNSMRPNPQMASCVVATVADDSWSINKTISNLGLFSKHGGGLACDFSALRATGSSIGKTGKSSGPIPFIRNLDSMVSSYNQLGARKGAAIAYVSWWHYDIKELLQLKDEGGTEDARARNLQYGLKINRMFLERFKRDQDITLFDPKDTPELLTTFGAEFDSWYTHYEQKAGIRRKTISAQDLAFIFVEQRSATGNWYVFFTENVHEQTPFTDTIFSSNLCNEIYLPAIAPMHKSNSLTRDEYTGELTATDSYDPGMIALCNLSSINVMTWVKLSTPEKLTFIYNLLRASDNLIDYAYYPVMEGYVSNHYFRSIGIGLSNLAQYFASQGILYTDSAAEECMFTLSEDIYYHILRGSMQLAKDRGRFEKFYSTKWKDGWLPFQGKTLPFRLSHDWDALRTDIQSYGVRFATTSAIAPTATSSLILGATEGILPIKMLVSNKTGNYSCKQIAPNTHKYRKHYQLAWDIPNSTHNTLAGIRQLFIDQGQSNDHFYTKVDSASAIMQDIIDAEAKGLKGLYYMNSLKLEDHEVCDSCSS